MFADALNVAAACDGDWSWRKGEEWTEHRRCVDAVLHLAQAPAPQLGSTAEPGGW